MEHADFEIKRNAVGRYYFVFKSDENRNLIVSESFSTRLQLEKRIVDLREAAFVAEICDEEHSASLPLFQVKKDAKGYICSLFGFSGRLIFTGEQCASKEECFSAAEIIKNLSPDAGVIDNTK